MRGFQSIGPLQSGDFDKYRGEQNSLNTAGIEPATLSVLTICDNPYTTRPFWKSARKLQQLKMQNPQRIQSLPLLSYLSTNNGLKDHAFGLEAAIVAQADNDTNFSNYSETITSNLMGIDSRTKGLVEDLRERLQSTINGISKQNQHRFSLQDSETKRSENQVMSLKTEQNEMIFKVPETISRIEFLESELGIAGNEMDDDLKSARANTR
eukprot:gene6887-13964_t